MKFGKAIGIGAGVFASVALSGVGLSWYLQAQAAKLALESTISQLNNGKPLLGYQAIETSGFPFRLTVSIVEPKLTVPADTLLKDWSATLPAAPDGSKQRELIESISKLPAWQEEMALDGKISFTVNMFSTEFSAAIIGPVATQSTLGEQHIGSVTESLGNFECKAELSRSNAVFAPLWHFARLYNDMQAGFQDLRTLECGSPGYVTSETGTKTVVMSAGAYGLTITNAPMPDGTTAVSIALSAADAEATPRFDELAANYARLFDNEASPGWKLSRYGKQSLRIAASWQGPQDPKQIHASTPFELRIDHLDFKNALSSISNTLRIANAPDGQNIKSDIALHSSLTSTEANDALLKEDVTHSIRKLLKPGNPRYNRLPDAIKAMTPQELMQIIEPGIPKLAPLSPLTIGFDGNYTGKPDLSTGSFSLENGEIAMAPYGVTFSGKGSASAPLTPPLGTLSLTCRACGSMIDDAGAYIGRLYGAILAIDPGMAVHLHFDTGFFPALKIFLQNLAIASTTSPASADWSYTLENNASGVTLNGKTLLEVQQTWQTQITPFLLPPPDQSPL